MNDHIESSEVTDGQNAHDAVSKVDKLDKIVSGIPSDQLSKILGSNPARGVERGR
jgi:hypothetical protein